VPSAFFNTEVDENVIMVLKAELAEMMVQIAPEVYRQYVTIGRKGNKVLLCKTAKGIVWADASQPSILLKIEEDGQVINPYDPFVTNKMTESEKQLTVVWHVDNVMGDV
jgi:hypothetical protein